MENSLLFIFGKIWPNTLYYSTGDFGPILEQLNKFVKNLILIGIISNFISNISTCICIRKNIKMAPFHFWPNTLYYSTVYLVQFLYVMYLLVFEHVCLN